VTKPAPEAGGTRTIGAAGGLACWRAGLSLAGVLMLARLLGLAGRDLPASFWLPSALIWQDAATALLFGAVACLLNRRLVWVVYTLLVGWIAVNVVAVRELSSPLTMTMLRASGTALTDSVTHTLTAANIACMALVAGAGALLPRMRARPGVRRTAGAALLLAAPGPFVATSLDLVGSQRNAVTALAAGLLPRLPVGGAADTPDLRATSFAPPPADDLRAFAGAARGRNIVLVILESTGAQYLKSYGAAEDPMPTMTALALEALQFEAYAVYPESVKGLFALSCSKAPAFDVSVHAHVDAPCAPLARQLAAAGYRTALFHSGRFGYLGMDALIASHGFDTRDDAGAIGGNVESSFGVDEPATVARMLSWIDQQDRDRPFFMIYMPIAGHHPYATATPGPFAGEGDRSAYKNALREADAALAMLLDGLRARGLDGQTMIVVMGDHGEAFGQHPGNYGHTLFVYDENVRVPLLVALPGVTTQPVRARQVASVLDIAPTVLDLAGLAPPGDYEGKSLLSGPGRLAFFFTDYALGWAGLRDGCWKYLVEVDADRSRLFDVCADPGETQDRAADQPARVQVYHERVLAWLSASRQFLSQGVGMNFKKN
jgi:arylsulfatase A-like enzyme